MIVLDSSVILDLLLRTGSWEAAEALTMRHDLHAPELLDVEVMQVLRRYRLHEGLTPNRATEAIEDLGSLPIERHRHELLLPRAWAMHRNLTAYDAIYVALAELLEVPLYTRDARLSRSTGHRATIELL